MEKIKNLSLKKTIVFYMTVSLICSFLLSAVFIHAAEYTQQQIWWKYIEEEKYWQAVNRETDDYLVEIPRPSVYDMSRQDVFVSEICDFLQTYGILVLSIAGSCIAVIMFYNNKLKKPIDELNEASKMIAENRLEFHVTYRNQDELGQLCREFEKMRRQLEENNRTVWRMVEDEKALRAAIAHDIRSPLAVLKGYQEMLLEFVPEGILDKEKTVEMLQEGMHQIDRMNRFIDNMKKMTKLGEREVKAEKTDFAALGQAIQTEGDMLAREAGKRCMVCLPPGNISFYADQEMILEVVENLLSNALRYAKSRAEVSLTLQKDELEITVSDDGTGFLENQEQVTQAFYHSNPQDGLQHFGMGMYISRIYCQRHGGRLLVSNQVHGGGVVKAVFHIYRRLEN